MDMPALPFCKLSLKAPKPLPSTYPQKPVTIGDHLRKRRLDLGLFQKEAANRLGTNESTVWYWENNQCIPSLRYLPKIISFLGYAPYNNATESTIKTLGDKIVAYRKYQGISQKELARYLRIDPSTLGHWERNERMPLKKLLERLESFFTSPPLIVS